MPVKIGPYVLDLDAHVIDGPAGRARLTPMERRFVAHLLDRRGQPVRGDDLLREVWGYHPSVESKAVPLLVSRLRRKVGDSPPLIQTAGGGYLIEAAHDDEALARRVDALVGMLECDVGALVALGRLAPELEHRLGEELPAAIEVRLRIGLSAHAAHQQVHRPARPLWELVDRVPPALGARAVLWAARLSLTAGSGVALREQISTWADRAAADPESLASAAELHLMMARVEHNAAAYPSARAHVDRALELGTRLGDPMLRGAALAEHARLAMPYCGGPGANVALELYQDAIATLDAGGVAVAAATQRANAAVTLYTLGRAAEAIEVFERAHPVLMRAGRRLDAALVRVNQGTARLACGDAAGALAAAEAASAVYAEDADFTGDAHARLLAGRAAAVLDRVADAVNALSRAKLLGERHGQVRVALHAARYLGWCAHRQGDLAGAREWYEVELAAGDARARAYLALWRAWAAGDAGVEPLRALRGELGRDPLEPVAGPEWVDATLSRRLLPGVRADEGRRIPS